MALRLIEGFETHSTYANVPLTGPIRTRGATTNTASFVAGTRFGTGQMMTSPAAITTTDGSSHGGLCFAVASPYTNGTKITVGFAVYLAALPTGANPAPLCSFVHGTAFFGASLFVTSTGALYLTGQGAAVTATSAAGKIASGAWAYVELEAAFSTSSTDSIVATAYVNGAQAVTLTQAGDANNVPDTFNLGVGYLSPSATLQGGGVNYDDLYMLDATGSTSTARLGDCRVETLWPSTESVNGGFSQVGGSTVPGVLGSSSAPSDDAATYYQSSGSAGTELILDSTDTLSSTSTSIFGVAVVELSSRADSTTSRAMAPVLKEGGGTETAGTAAVLNSTGEYVQACFSTQPSSSAAWTKSAAEAALFGVRITA